jgi:hypothetical protein
MTDYTIKDKVALVGNLFGDPMQEVQIGDAVEVVWEDHERGTLAQWQLGRTG